MKQFAVTYGYRTDDGMNYGTPTHHGRLVVHATDAQEARRAAIDLAYATHKDGCSHVIIESVEEVTES